MRPNQQFVDSLTIGAKWITQFSTGAYGGMILVPHNYTGSTASGRTFKIGTSTPQNTYFQVSGGYRFGIFQDGTNWGGFDLATSKPQYIDNSDYLNQPMLGTNINQTQTSVGHPWVTVDYEQFDTSLSGYDTLTTGWCLLRWDLDPNVTVSFRPPLSQLGTESGYKIYFYQCQSDNFTYDYTASASNIAISIV